MDEIRNFSTQLFTDLVNKNILAKEVNGAWTLVTPIFGYQANVAFHNKEELIQKLVAGAMSQYGGLKVA